jgi:exopolysaccharide biosynthesis polyprenyl glycosylphosphotransferase
MSPETATRPRRDTRTSGANRGTLPLGWGKLPDLSESSMRALSLQDRGSKLLRQHLLRSLRRVLVLVAADVGAFMVCRWLVYLMRDSGAFGVSAQDLAHLLLPVGSVDPIQLGAAVVGGLAIVGAYGSGDRRRDPGRLLGGTAIGVMVQLWPRLWSAALVLVVIALLALTIFLWGGLCAERILLDWAIRPSQRREPQAVPRVLLVGTAAECARIAKVGPLTDLATYRIVGRLDLAPGIAPPAIAALLADQLVANDADAVAIAGTLHGDLFRATVDTAQMAGCQVLQVPEEVDTALLEPQVLWRKGVPILALTRPTLRGWQMLAKRTLDLVVGGIGLVLAAPLLAAIWLLVRLDSKGPALYGHTRLGQNAKPFKCLKFRSMRPDAEQLLVADPGLYARYVANGFKLPEEEDPRITRLGRFLRKSSLDELPQLFNVLRGDMSVVGPRPIVHAELSHYGEHAAYFLALKPGITGAWQVEGRSNIGYPDRVHIELQYVRKWSIFEDIRILLMTIPAVLSRRGAH